MSLAVMMSPHLSAPVSQSSELELLAHQLIQDGFLQVSADFYQAQHGEFDHFQQLVAAQLDYYSLSPDPAGFGRFRSHSRYQLQPGDDAFTLETNNAYMQSSAYNYDDGDVVRHFAAVSPAFLNNPLLQHMLQCDLALTRKTELVDWSRPVTLGLHQVRYWAKPDEPSISSPIWLHRDDEPVVFIHLFNLSAGVLGGDNLISSGGRKVDRVLRLTNPLDTLVVGQKVLHAVTPIGTEAPNGAIRDILLVTFANEVQA